MKAYLGFYDPPFAQSANDALWSSLRDHARALGLSVPDDLDRTTPYRSIWTAPDLAFAQTCGLPLITSLAGRVRVLATPVYDFAGCDGPAYSSLIVTRADASFATLKDLRGTRAAINSRDSHSGYVALRHTLIDARDTFVEEIETGGHLNSLLAVLEARADVCACDCVTFGLIARHRPDQVAGLQVLARSEAAPAPPFVTRGGASDSEVDLWREALQRTFDDPQSAPPRAALGLHGFEILPLSAYDQIADMAAAVGVTGSKDRP